MLQAREAKLPGLDLEQLNFDAADRRCRLASPPDAKDLISRGTALDALGFRDAASADFEHAARPLTAQDVGGCRAIMAHSQHGATRSQVASLLLSNSYIPDALTLEALRVLDSVGRNVLLLAQRNRHDVHAQLYAKSGAEIRLIGRRVRAGQEFPVPENLTNAKSFRDWYLRGFEFRDTGSDILELLAEQDGKVLDRTVLYPQLAAPADRPSKRSTIPGKAAVVVPVYGDPDSLVLCLDALKKCRADISDHVVVDDFSPDPRVSAIARDFCADVRGRYLRLETNVGFAEAVNAGLRSLGEGRPVLILNSDVVVPPDAVARLLRAGTHADVGTVSAFSNDAGHTSFPVPFQKNPSLSAGSAQAIDDCARDVNRGQVFDVFVNLASCLLITAECRRRVGDFSGSFGRGYYEDVDYSLRTREMGFRNVVAADLYVAHAGGRSFGSSRGALIARNRKVLDLRFPNFSEEAQAAMLDDRRSSLRSRIEENLVPDDADLRIVLGPEGHGVASRVLADDELRACSYVVSAEWSRPNGQVELALRRVGDGLPHSLRFRFGDDGEAELERYLDRLRPRRISIFDAEHLPAEIGRVFRGSTCPAALIIDGQNAWHAWARRDGESWLNAEPSDRMAGAAMRPLAESPRTDSPAKRDAFKSPVARLGILVPEARPATDRLLIAVARQLRSISRIRLIVLGSCVDDKQVMASDNVHVSGPMVASEMEQALRHYGVGAVMSPDRRSGFGLIDYLAARVGLPKAYFDWTNGRFRPDPGDLSIPSELPDSDVVARLAQWCAGDALGNAA